MNVDKKGKYRNEIRKYLLESPINQISFIGTTNDSEIFLILRAHNIKTIEVGSIDSINDFVEDVKENINYTSDTVFLLFCDKNTNIIIGNKLTSINVDSDYMEINASLRKISQTSSPKIPI